MRSYIDSEILHRLVVDAFGRGVIVAAICHGVLLAARSVDPKSGHSVLFGRRTTALTWALGAHRLAADQGHPVLGPRLLPHLQRAARPAVGVYVGCNPKSRVP